MKRLVFKMLARFEDKDGARHNVSIKIVSDTHSRAIELVSEICTSIEEVRGWSSLGLPYLEKSDEEG